MKHHAAFWITLARSGLAVSLGLALILQPEKTRPMLVNFMGMFWLMAGLVSLRWSTNGERAQRISVVAGIVGIAAGALVLTRFFISRCAGTASRLCDPGDADRADRAGACSGGRSYRARSTAAAIVDRHAVRRI
jgi:uncharacterized membrane protein HdeD (DUF308 family)